MARAKRAREQDRQCCARERVEIAGHEAGRVARFFLRESSFALELAFDSTNGERANLLSLLYPIDQ